MQLPGQRRPGGQAGAYFTDDGSGPGFGDEIGVVGFQKGREVGFVGGFADHQALGPAQAGIDVVGGGESPPPRSKQKAVVPEMVVTVADADVEGDAPVELLQRLFRIRAGLQDEIDDVQIAFPLCGAGTVPESQMGKGGCEVDALSLRRPVKAPGEQDMVFLPAFRHASFGCVDAALAGEQVAEMLPKFGVVTVAAGWIFRDCRLMFST